jgi:hypothetical protein
MKRNLLLLAVMVVAALFFSSQSWGNCGVQPFGENDLGICDTIYIATIPCDHTYEATGAYDSVRVGIWVTHDSNTFEYSGQPGRWLQDSIKAFTIPLYFWHEPNGNADSVICPDWDNWNNIEFTDPDFVPRSVFRDIVCPEGTIPNFMKTLKWNYPIFTVYDGHSCQGDSGLILLTVLNLSKKCWYEESHQLLATITFLVYMHDGADFTKICFDSTYVDPASADLNFVRIDAQAYVPRHFLPYCDSIYIVPCLPPNFTANPSDESQHINGPYTTTTTFAVSAGNPSGDAGGLLTGVTAVSRCPDISIVSVNYDANPPQATLSGTITYNVDNHCSPGCYLVLTASNDCEPVLTASCSLKVNLSNNPPTLTTPPNVQGPYNQTMNSTDFSTSDPDNDHVTVDIDDVSPVPTNMPTIVAHHVAWVPTCAEVSNPITVTLTATDTCGVSVERSFTMHATNLPPTCGFDAPATLPTSTTKTLSFTYDDPEGDVASITASVGPDCGSVSTPVYADGEGTFDYTTPSEAGFCVVCVTVTDGCGLYSVCCDTIEIKAGIPNVVMIPNKVYERFNVDHWGHAGTVVLDSACQECEADPNPGINPGDFFEIPILLGSIWEPPIVIGGFEFEVQFDYIDLTFYGAGRGDLLTARWTEPYPPDPNQNICKSWEYFTYRLCPCTVSGCLKYKIIFYGQAEMPDGDLRRGYYLDMGDLDAHIVEQDIAPFNDLVWMKFQVANNELLRDLKLPVEFEWTHKLSTHTLQVDCPEVDAQWAAQHNGEHFGYYIIQDWDCGENAFSDETGNQFYVSGDPHQYAAVNMCTGDPICGDLFQYPPEQILYFIDGGPHICSPCTTFKCVRGDINLDHVPNTVADAVLLARYFVYGINVFDRDRAPQVCATDVNADGRTLMLSDLIYLIRVAQNDAVPYPKLGPSSDIANVIISDGKISVECASAIGGLLFKFDGNVTPTLLNTSMDLLSNEGNVLVWSSAGNSIAGASELLNTSGAKLVSVIAVDREGRDLATTITTKLTPTAFALHPAYPNPFNPNTNLSFTLPNAIAYSMNIYNVAGQLVRSYEGMGNVGLNVITWDGRDNAGNEVSSGVYFYKLSAGSFTATNKMVMMK